MRRRQLRTLEALRQQTTRHCDEAGKTVGCESLVRPGHRQHDGVAYDAAQAGKVRLEQTRHAARFGLVEQRREHLRRVRLVGNDEDIDATAASVEHVLRALARHVDIRHQCGTRDANAQLAHPLKICAAIDIQVENDHVDRSAFAGPGE